MAQTTEGECGEICLKGKLKVDIDGVDPWDYSLWPYYNIVIFLGFLTYVVGNCL
jgi:hypothetical protein